MFSARKLVRLLTVASVAAVGATVGAVPASGNSALGVASFDTCAKAVSDVADGYVASRCVSGVMTARVVRGTGTVIYVHFECVADGVVDPASMTMEYCSLGGVDAIDVPHTAPGAVIAQAGVLVTSTNVPLSACIGATARWFLPGSPVSGGTCRTISFSLMSVTG